MAHPTREGRFERSSTDGTAQHFERGSREALDACTHRRVQAQINARRIVDGPHGPILIAEGHTAEGSREWAEHEATFDKGGC
jgi:hypothetical protein